MFFIIPDKFGSFHSHTIKNVINEGIHDAHRFFRNAYFRVHLFKHLVDVDSEGLSTFLLPFFADFSFNGFRVRSAGGLVSHWIIG